MYFKVSDMINLKKILSGKSKRFSFLSSHIKLSTPVIYAPGTQIIFDPNLVARLKKDHSHLLDVFRKIVGGTERRDYEKIRALNEVFLSLFNAHALLEYTKLYVFLDYSFRSEKNHHDVILRFRREMNEIGRNVRGFCHYWRENAVVDSNLQEYKSQLNQIGEVLTKRIDTEEQELYAMYDMAPSRFAASIFARH
jgi:regulator of sigma D